MLGKNLKGFQHLGLPVTDITVSKAFYARLGFSEVMSKELQVEDGTVYVAMMGLNGFLLELYQLDGKDLEEIAGRHDGHIDHFALDVDDVDKVFEAIKAAGIDLIQQEPEFLPFWEHGIRYFVIHGPDGEKVEFCERLKG